MGHLGVLLCRNRCSGLSLQRAMAFTSRAARKLGLAHKSTGDTVGPGSYSMERSKPVTGYAPFGAFSERKLGDTKGLKTGSNPGPGSYDGVGYGKQIEPAKKRDVSSQPFVSKAPRVVKQTAGSSVYKESSVKENPGPGAYSLHKDWGTVKPPAHEHHALSIRHTQSAPSIPAGHQSYGYEEDALGELQMQAPPVKGFTGRKGFRSMLPDGSSDDAAGPGQYTPKVNLAKSSSIAVSFGASKASREQGSIFSGKIGPGAGAYDPMLAVGSAPDKKGSSNFKTKTKRMQYMKDSKKTPGPGSYGYQDSFSKAAMPLEESIQFFGSTQKRWYEVNEAQSYAAPFSLKTPGPGAYSVGDEMKKKQGKAKHSFLKTGEVGFSSTTSRQLGADAKSETTAPGPGAYGGDNSKGQFVHQLEKRLRSRTGAFGSSDERFREGPMSEQEAIPEEEEVKPVRKNEPQKFPKQSTFLSHSDRFVEPETDMPAPGAYELGSDWSVPKNTTLASNQSFASSAARFNPKEVFTGCPLKEIPAPGDYDKITTDKPREDGQKGFLTTQKRFKADSKKLKQPGPGAYRVQEGMIKRSFNVSIDI